MTITEQQKVYREALSKIYDGREATAITKLVFEQTLEINPVKLAFERFRNLTPPQQENLSKILNRLLNHEPVQYVLGQTEFCGLKLKLSSAVLIPRPETEELVQWILSTVKKSDEGFRILDIGTGSGCIALALAKGLPLADVHALDKSAGALQIAELNARLNNVRVTFTETDILERGMERNNYDIIVSNPPYVRAAEKDTLAKHVIDFEPHLALFAPGEDGLVFYRTIAEKARQALRDYGTLFFETHSDLAANVKAILLDKGYNNVEVRQDLSGRDRMVMAKK